MNPKTLVILRSWAGVQRSAKLTVLHLRSERDKEDLRGGCGAGLVATWGVLAPTPSPSSHAASVLWPCWAPKTPLYPVPCPVGSWVTSSKPRAPAAPLGPGRSLQPPPETAPTPREVLEGGVGGGRGSEGGREEGGGLQGGGRGEGVCRGQGGGGGSAGPSLLRWSPYGPRRRRAGKF